MLREMQRRFVSHLFEGAEELAVYRGNVIGAHVGALENIFPVCRRLVGEDFFRGMARIYTRSNPAYSPDLADYGWSFTTFVRDFTPARDLEYLADVAELEWAWHRALHAAGGPRLDVDSLGRVPPKQHAKLIFQRAPSLSPVRSPYPIHRIWRTNQADCDGEERVDLEQGGVHLLVWRRGNDLRIDPVSASEWSFLAELEPARRFEAVCQALEQKGTGEIADLLARAIRNEWICAFRPS